MKKSMLLFSFFFVNAIVFAQNSPKTLDDLKAFIGIDCATLEKQMKQKNYVYMGKDNDEKKGPFTWKMFDADTDDDNYHDIYPICNSERVVGVSFEMFTEDDYSKILDYMRANGYKKTVSRKMVVNVGSERVDLWVSADKKWQVKVDYDLKVVSDAITLTEITLSTSAVNWGLD